MDVDDRRQLTIGGAALVLAALPWLPPFRHSLWLDEIGSRWIIDRGFLDTIQRTHLGQGESPFYFLILWVARAVLGSGEVALRLPSLLFLVGAAALVYRFGVRLLGREGGVVAALVYVSSRHVMAEASDARPYALAQLVAVGSTLVLVRWCERGRARDAILYVFLAAATVYAHCLFATLTIVHLAYAVARRRAGGPVAAPHIVGAALGVLALLLPLVPQLLTLFERRVLYSYTGTPPPWKLVAAVAPPLSVAAIVVGMVVSRLCFRSFRIDWRSPRPPEPLLLVSWLVVPPVVLFLVSHLSGAKIFAPHYYMVNEPAFALLAAWAVLRMQPAQVRLPVFAALVLASVANLRVRPPPHQDWRGAAAAIERLGADGGGPMPVLCGCGFLDPPVDWLTDPLRYSFLMSPFLAYPVSGPTQRLPGARKEPAIQAYFEATVTPLVAGARRFVLVTRGDPSWEARLGARFGPAGFRARPLGHFTNVEVTVFERPASQ